MNTFQRFFKKALASLMLAGLCLCFVTNACGQCPTDIAPTTISWTGPSNTNITIPGTTCQVKVIYCTRVVSGVEQVVVEEIDPLSSDCNSVNWSTILGTVRDYFLKYYVETDPCDPNNPCGGSLITEASIFMAECLQVVKEDGVAAVQFCGGAYCVKTCGLCYDDVDEDNALCNCQTTVVGSSSCSTAPDGWPNTSVGTANNWPSQNFGACFTTSCDSY